MFIPSVTLKSHSLSFTVFWRIGITPSVLSIVFPTLQWLLEACTIWQQIFFDLRDKYCQICCLTEGILFNVLWFGGSLVYPTLLFHFWIMMIYQWFITGHDIVHVFAVIFIEFNKCKMLNLHLLHSTWHVFWWSTSDCGTYQIYCLLTFK